MGLGANFNKAGAAVVRSFLLEQGFTKAGTYGMMANIYAESNFYGNNLQNSYNKKLGMDDDTYTARVDNKSYTREQFTRDSAGYGLCQWTYWSRKQNLYDYAAKVGASIGSVQMQLEFLMQELNAGYKDMLATLKSSINTEACAKLVMTRFERPADQSDSAQNRRAGYATDIKNLFESHATEPTVKPLRVVLDAGHGKNTAGKRCLKSIDPNETREWTLNSRIASMVQELLIQGGYNCEVLRVDDPANGVDVPLSTRTKEANNFAADVYISIHHNAGVNGSAAGGTVVYYYGSNPMRTTQARRLYSLLVNNTGLKGNRANPVIKKGFYVLANTNMPAFLIENGFMDSSTDVPMILTQEHAMRTAQAIVQFLVDFGMDSTAPQYYPACADEYKNIPAALNSVGVDGSYTYRAKIAIANGITDYRGTAEQNTYMLKLLKAGKLKKV